MEGNRKRIDELESFFCQTKDGDPRGCAWMNVCTEGKREGGVEGGAASLRTSRNTREKEEVGGGSLGSSALTFLPSGQIQT